MSGARLPLNVTKDAFLGGALTLLQPKQGYRAGIDAVLLAACVPVKAHCAERVMDVGAGIGTVGLAVARRCDRAHVALVERDPAVADLARRNIACNGLTGRVEMIEADITRRLEDLPQLRQQAETLDHVVANPPFNAEGRGTVSADPLRAAASLMPGGDLARWARFMAAMVRPGGTATLIHRADCIGEVLSALAGRFGSLVIFPLFPREGKPATRVLVQGVKGSGAAIELRRGLVLHGADGGFRPDVERMLREGAPLSLSNDG